MSLIELFHRSSNPAPWSEGDNIPWNDPEFSKRMLQEHLTQDHDMASRKFERIDKHVAWIHKFALQEKPSKILDICCGPGLYANRLAGLGHQVVGIDFSPASIAYANETAVDENPGSCEFIEGDVRQTEYGTGFDAALLIYGEFNVFKTADIWKILSKVYHALNPGGILILEPHTYEAVENWGKSTPSWFTSESGLFHTEPHLVLFEYFWGEDSKCTTQRYFVIDLKSGKMTRFAQSVQAYTRDGYQSLLESCGFSNVQFFPSLMGSPDPDQSQLLAIMARKN